MGYVLSGISLELEFSTTAMTLSGARKHKLVQKATRKRLYFSAFGGKIKAMPICHKESNSVLNTYRLLTVVKPVRNINI